MGAVRFEGTVNYEGNVRWAYPRSFESIGAGAEFIWPATYTDRDAPKKTLQSLGS